MYQGGEQQNTDISICMYDMQYLKVQYLFICYLYYDYYDNNNNTNHNPLATNLVLDLHTSL